MSDANAIDSAARRLAAALDALDAALEQREETDQMYASRSAEVQAHGTDRARLASELDAAVARTRKLETTNREIARRLDAAINTIKAVLVPGDR
jgi:hypothetical protein